MVTEKRWQVAPPAPPEYIAQLHKLHPILAQILYNRGYHEADDARAFLAGQIEESSPFSMKGIHRESLKKLADEGAQVVVTVDCGIRSWQEVEDANSFGLEMIISDHHSIGPRLPPALAVINPKQEDCKYPHKKLAGVGIAYKLAEALFELAIGLFERLDLSLELVEIGDASQLFHRTIDCR